MDLTETQLDLLFSAWLLARDDKGLVPTEHAIPDADQLADHDWLERREVDTDDSAYFWTGPAETALHLSTLTTDAQDRQN